MNIKRFIVRDWLMLSQRLRSPSIHHRQGQSPRKVCGGGGPESQGAEGAGNRAGWRPETKAHGPQERVRGPAIQTEPELSLLRLYVLFRRPTDWMRPTHIVGTIHSYSVYPFKCQSLLETPLRHPQNCPTRCLIIWWSELVNPQVNYHIILKQLFF